MTEDDCLALIRSGGKSRDAGLHRLYELMGQRFLRFFASHGLSADDGCDVMQEAMIRIVRGSEGFTGDGTAASWMWQIARNCLMDHFRRIGARATHLSVFGDDEWQRILEGGGGTRRAPEDARADGHGSAGYALPPDLVPDQGRVSGSPLAGDSIDECVSEGLARFRKTAPDRAHALELQMDGSSIEEIAAVIGRTPGAAKEYLSQSRKKLGPFIAHCVGLLRDSPS